MLVLYAPRFSLKSKIVTTFLHSTIPERPQRFVATRTHLRSVDDKSCHNYSILISAENHSTSPIASLDYSDHNCKALKPLVLLLPIYLMAPFFVSLMPRSQTFDFTTARQEFRSQWTHPSDVFSVLLILGPDVISRALAQLAGGALTPVAFSFGEFRVIQRHAPCIGLKYSNPLLYFRLGRLRSISPCLRRR